MIDDILSLVFHKTKTRKNASMKIIATSIVNSFLVLSFLLFIMFFAITMRRAEQEYGIFFRQYHFILLLPILSFIVTLTSSFYYAINDTRWKQLT